MSVEMSVMVSGFFTLLGTQLWMAYLVREARREAEASLQALMHGQEHIAELVAEVLRRTRP